MKKQVAFGALLLVVSFCAISFGQAQQSQAAATLATSIPQMTKHDPVAIDFAQPAQFTVGSNIVFDAKTGGVVGATKASAASAPRTAASSSPVRTGTIDGLVTLDTFDGAFAAQNGPSTGNVFRFSMMGNHPLRGGPTFIPAQIVEVSLTLLNADGSTFAVVPYQPFDWLTLRSPNFSRSNYSSGFGIQYADAVQRAEFFNKMGPGWHTNLTPKVVDRVNITVPKFVNVRLSNGTVIQATAYFTGTGSDGSTFVLMLNLLFDFFFENQVNNEINLGNFTTNGINMNLFPNTYLFSLNTANPNTPGRCCVLGFHTYFFDSSQVPQPRWVSLYASWISPGIFGGGFLDITALSHETSEAFNDPFVDNATPSWQFPGQPTGSTVCQGNLEVGDPIEVLTNATTPVTIRGEDFSYTYHPQEMALLQWFEMGTTSSALNGLFSFPDPVLPKSAVPCGQ